MLPDFFFCSFFPVQQTTSEIGHRVKYYFLIVFRVGNQYAECETTIFSLNNNSNNSNNNNSNNNFSLTKQLVYSSDADRDSYIS